MPQSQYQVFHRLVNMKRDLFKSRQDFQSLHGLF
jgi:hypothetical protein